MKIKRGDKVIANLKRPGRILNRRRSGWINDVMRSYSGRVIAVAFNFGRRDIILPIEAIERNLSENPKRKRKVRKC